MVPKKEAVLSAPCRDGRVICQASVKEMHGTQLVAVYHNDSPLGRSPKDLYTKLAIGNWKREGQNIRPSRSLARSLLSLLLTAYGSVSFSCLEDNRFLTIFDLVVLKSRAIGCSYP